MAYTFEKCHLEVIQQNNVTMKVVNKTYYNIFLYYEQMYNRTAQVVQGREVLTHGTQTNLSTTITCL